MKSGLQTAYHPAQCRGCLGRLGGGVLQRLDLLVVEVADSSLDSDRNTKAPLYATSGVSEVWIVDLAGRAVEVYRDPVDGRYASVARMTEGRVNPIRIPEVAVDIASLVG